MTLNESRRLFIDDEVRTPCYYPAMWCTMDVRPGWGGRVQTDAGRARKHQHDLYENLPADWRLIAVIHLMECGCRPDRQIFNGEPWDQETVLHPAHHGPWPSWRDAAIDALERHPLRGLADIEAWNGWGYAKRNMHSPYLWSGSNHYAKGKFVADGKFDLEAISKQVGAALVLQALGWAPL